MKQDKNPLKKINDNKNSKNSFLKYLPYLLILIIIGLIVYFVFFYSNAKLISIQEFLNIIQNKDFKNSLNKMTYTLSNGMYVINATYIDNGVSKNIEVIIPYNEYWTNVLTGGSVPAGDNLPAELKDFFGASIYAKQASNGFWLNLFFNLLPILLILGVGFFMYRSMAKGKGLDFGINKNKARLSTSKVKFADVAGYEEEKSELVEIVDFLSKPQRFQAMGARIPKGVILEGAPGTGKTMLAQAVAGEANVPFFINSGADFVEMFVGLGASRVRELFKTAKKVAPCIIFIDEIDSVGRQRGAGMGGGNDEREQTLNQLLVEMDGFDPHSGIVIMAATNRPDVLDPALLRPGRFDRKIEVHLPNIKEREAILKVHSRNKNVSSKVDYHSLAKKTPGFSGAQLENVLNEAALLAIRFNKKVIGNEEISEAIDRVIAGLAKPTKTYIQQEKELVAYHEAGHALIGIRLENGDKVEKITIIPRGMAGGYTLLTPQEEKFFLSKKALLEKITSFLGGRAAEEIYFGEENITSGAQNDIQQITTIARKMVTEFGMSELGLVRYEENTENPFLGKDYSKINASAQINYEIDKKVKEIIDQCYIRAKEILLKDKKVHKLLVEALLKYETIDSSEIEYIVKNEKLPEEKVNENPESHTEKLKQDKLTFSPNMEEKKQENNQDKNDKENLGDIDTYNKLQ